MWAVFAVCYLAVGFVAAGLTLAVFPPTGDYRPPWHILVLAVGAYALLWPFLAMIAIGYAIGIVVQSRRDPVRPIASPARHRSRFVYRTLYEETPN
jgi:hypothetical protein